MGDLPSEATTLANVHAAQIAVVSYRGSAVSPAYSVAHSAVFELCSALRQARRAAAIDQLSATVIGCDACRTHLRTAHLTSARDPRTFARVTHTLQPTPRIIALLPSHPSLPFFSQC